MKLRLSGIGKTFKSSNGSGPLVALEGVTLEVAEGEFTCLVGPSGCGKSTLLNIVGGFERPDTGSITYDGVEVEGGTGGRVMIFQEPALFPWLTVQKNVEFGLKMAGVAKAEREARASAYLNVVHLSRFAGSLVHELSGGMKQRVALARALALNPDVLLMDEPFGSLDAQTREMLHELLLAIWSRTKKTILFVTHDVREAVILSDRVLTFGVRPGRIKSEFRIRLPRPRDLSHAEVGRVAALIHDDLKEEVDKIAAEEFDGDWLGERDSLLSAVSCDMGLYI